MSARPERSRRQAAGTESEFAAAEAREPERVETGRRAPAAVLQRSDFEIDAWEPSLLAKLLGIDNEADDGSGQG